MKKSYLLSFLHSKKNFLLLILFLLMVGRMSAVVTITAPSLTIGTCSVYPTNYHPLGNIVITEGANSDFAAGSPTSTVLTLVFTAPANFEFLAGTGSVAVAAGNNLGNESITVTATTITVSYTSGGTNKSDVMTISGIQVRGITASATQNVTRTGGTGTVNGLINTTSVATLISTNVGSPTAGTAVSSAAIPMCNNTPTTLSVPAGTDGTSYQWQSSPDNVTFTNISGATSGTYIYTPTTVSSLYFRRIVTCGTTATSGSVLVTSQVCDCTTGCTATSVSVDLSGATDTSYSISTVSRNGLCCLQTGTKCIRFDIQVNPGSDLINFQVASPAPPGGATYQIDCGAPTSLGTPACISGGSHCIVFCKAGNDSPTYTIIATRTIQGSNDITVRQGCAGALSVTGLQTSSITWTSIYPGASGAYNSYLSCTAGCATTNVTPATGSPAYIDYMVSGSPNTSCPGTSRDTVRVYIVPGMTVALSPVSPVICSGGPGSVTLTATPTGGAPPYTYSWSTGATTQSISVSAAGTYTVNVSDATASCPPVSSTITVAANPTPAAPTAANTTICTGTTATLTATAPGGTYAWYSAASGGTLLATSSGYTTPVLTTTTTYYVETNVGGCLSPRTAVTVTVSPVPAAPTAAGTTICQGSTATLNATAPGGTYEWYSAASGGTLLSTGAGYTSPALSANTTYYVQTTVAGCTGPRTAVTVTVTPTPVAPTAAGATICEGTTATLTATAPGGTYQWYDAASGGTLLNTGASYTTPSLIATTTYYVQTTVSGCAGPRTAVTVTVTPTPAAPTASGTTICQGTSASLTATAPGGTYAWYDAASGGTLLVTNATYTTPSLSATTTYYVQTTVSGCAGPRTAVTVTVTPTPAAPAAAGTTICQGTTATLTATAPGGTYDWYDAASGGTLLATGASYTSPSLAATTTYYVQTTVSGCAGPRTAVTVTVTPTPAAPTAAGATICQGTGTTLTATAPGGTYAWYTAASGGTLLVTSASYTTPALSVTTTYYVQTTISGCPGPRTAVTVTVTPAPAAPTASGTTICQGTTATLTATAPGGTYDWYNAASGGTLLGTGASFTSPALAATTTYYVQSTVSGCAGPRTAVTVTVTPTPAAPTASGTTICTGTSTTLTATAPGGTYAWYDAASGGTLLVTAASYTTPVLTVSTTYYVQTTIAGCAGPRTAVTVTVSPVPAAPTAAGAAICTGTSTTLTATAPGGTYAWYDAASGGTLLVTAASYATPVLTSTTTYYVQTTVAGCAGPRTAVTVTVSPVPAAPTAASATICSGSTASLSATAPGGTYEWYDAASGGTLLATGAGYTTPALTSTTTYYVQTTVSGCTGPRTAVTVTVNPIPAAPTAANATRCAGSTATLTATAPGGSYQWYDAASGGTLLASTASYTTPALSATTSYYVQTTVGGCTSPRTTVTVTVNPIPAAPTASGTTICQGTTATLTATAPGGTYAWFTASTGGTLLFTGASYTTPALAATTTYYVQTTVTGCASPRTAVTVTVTPTPAAPTASGATICSGSTATLTATAPGGTYDWFSAATGGTSLSTGASYTTPALTSTTTYYVQTTISGCAGPRTAVTVTVNPIPASPTVSGTTTICEGTTTTLTATAPGGTYEWYNAASGGTLLATASAYSTPALSATTTYYVQTTIAGCTGPRTAITVNVIPTPAAPTAAGTTICQGTTATLTATAPGGTYEWYDAASGGTLLATAAGYTTASLSTTTTYYVQTTISGCTGPRTAVTVTVTPTPAAPTAAGATICSGSTATLTATAPGGTYEWYSAATGGTLLVTGAGYTTPSLTSTTTYYVQTTISGCTGPRTAVTVTVNPIPAAPTAANITICSGSTGTITATAPGGSYQWYDAASGGALLASTAAYTTPALSATTVYYVQTTIAGCTGPRTAVTVAVNPIPAAPTSSGTTICQGTTATLTATAPGGTYRWFPVPTGGSVLATAATYTTPSLSATTTYYVQTTVGGCVSPRTAVTVTVTPTPAAPAASNSTICEGTSATLTATAPGGAYEWYDAATAGTLLIANANYTTPSLTVTTTYYVQTTISGCTGPRTAVTVTVIPTDDPSFNYSSGTYCITGTNPSASITGGATGTFSATPAGLVFSNTSTGTINLGASALNTYAVTFTTNGTCPSSSTVNITVTNAPSAVFSYSTPYCQNDPNALPVFAAGASAGVFTATPSGLIFMSTSTGEIDLAASTPGTYTVTNNIAAAGGCAAATASSSITINLSPQVNAGSDQVICQGTTAAITGTIGGAASSATWSGGAGSFSSTTSLSTVYTPGAGESNAMLFLTTNDPAGPCTSITDTVEITITPTPASPTAAGATICAGGTATLSATAPGGTYDWYDATSGGTLLATGAVYTTPSLSTTTVYYVQTTISGCAGPRTAVTVTVNPIPASPTAAGTAICSGSSITLNATAPGGTYEWYDASTGGTLLATSASYTTPSLTATTNYYVQSTISGCTGPRTIVTVTVNPIPPMPTASNITICNGSTGTVTATAPGGTYQWFDAATGGTLLASTANYTSPPLTSTTTYYVQATIAGCTGPRKAVTISVNPVPVAPTAAGTTICEGTSTVLSATAPGGTYRWYPVPTGGSVLFTGANYTTPVLSTTTTYYVQTTVGGCTSPRTAVTVTVTPSPAAPTAPGVTICTGSTATLTATAPGGSYEWYSAATGGTLLASGSSYTTPALTSTTSYYVQTTISGCVGPRTIVTVTVSPIEDPSFTYSSGTYCPLGTNPSATITGGASGTFSSSPSGLVFVNSSTGEINLSASAINTYSVTFTTSGTCSASSSMNITITDAPNASFSYNNTCSNGPNPFPVFGPGQSAGVFSTLTPGLVFVNTATGEVDLSLTPPGNYNLYNYIAPSPGCPAAGGYSDITIEPTVTVNAGPDKFICGSGTATLTGTIGGAASSASWSGGSGSFSNINSLTTIYTPAAGETSATLILTSNDPAGSCSAVSDTVIVTVNPIPSAPVAAGTTICEGTTATLTATAPGGTYQWFNVSTGGTALSTGAVFTTPVLSASTTFYVQTSVSGCAGPRTGVAVTVTPTDNSSFSYSSGTFCISGSNPTPSVAAGVTGTFSSTPSGLLFINAATGEINLAASALNTYSITFTTDGACPASSSVNVTITNAPNASFSYSGPYCPSGINPLPNFPSGSSAGVFSASPAGLNFVNTSTGEINLSTTTPGTYTITNNIAAAGGCAAATASSNVTIDPAPTVNAGPDQIICLGSSVNLAGTFGGSASNVVWSGGSGSFSLTSDPNAVYTPSAGETFATLTLTTNDPAGSCGPVSDNVAVTFQIDTSSFSYPGSVFCASGTNPVPLITGGYTGMFSSSPSGLVFVNPSTGEINLSASALNTYTITFTSSGICPNSTSTNITVTNGFDATFSYSGPYCQSGVNPVPSFGPGANAGVFSSSPAGLTFVNTSTGEIDLVNTAPGTYLITNSIAASGGCAGVTATSTVTIDPAAVVDAGPDRFICIGETVTLAGTASGAATSVTWSGGTGSFSDNTDLNAVYTPAPGETSVLLILTSNDPAGPCGIESDSIIITISPIPAAPTASDTTICSGGSVTLTATAPGGTYQWYDAASGGTLLITNASYTTPALTGNTTYYVQTTVLGCTSPQTAVDVTVTPAPVVNAGTDQSVCSNNAAVMLSGTVTNVSGGVWSTTGSGTFSPNDSSLTATYTPSGADIAAGNVILSLSSIGNCQSVTDSMVITFTPSPVVNAGTDQYICEGTITASLNGSVSGGAVTGQWTTLGSGTFSANDTLLNANYLLSAADTSAGTVTLVLTSTSNGTCIAVTDTMQISITTIPVTNAGADTTVCGNNPVVQLNGSVTGGTGVGYWTSSGTGTFAPSDSVLNPVYTPGAGDISSGTVILVLTPFNSCMPVRDSVTVTITSPTLTDVGADITVCNSVGSVTLNGSVSGGTVTGTWISSGSGSFSSADSLNAVYTFSTADTASGSVTLILTSTNNGICSAQSDTMTITITDAITAMAGTDQIVCANNAVVSLNGMLNGGTAAVWSSSGSGSFMPSDSALITSYVPSSSDIASGNIILTLTPLSTCTSVADSLLLTITPAPVVNAGTDMTICNSFGGIALSGTMDTVATGGVWTSNGTGSFLPNDSALNAMYIPGVTDNDTLVFVLTSYGNGLCNPVTDTVIIIRNIPPAAAFTASSLCEGQTTAFSDSSNANGGTIISWTWDFGSGGGASAMQNPTFAYPSSGTYNVSLIVSSGTGCNDTTTQTITINPVPVAAYSFFANCQNTTATFTDASTGTITSWSWNFGDGNSSSFQNPSNLFDSAGVYNVVLTVTSDSGCTSVSTQALTINPAPVAGFNPSVSCSSLTFGFTDTSSVSSGSIQSYNWTFGDGGTSVIQNPSNTYSDTGSYSVTLIVQTNNGCADTSSLMVSPGSPVTADYTPQGGNFNVNEVINFNNQSVGGTIFSWNFDDGSPGSVVTDPSHGFAAPGTYSVVLMASNQSGCSDTISYDFVITSNGTAVPTGFTPNNDGLNDYFYVLGNFSSYELRVFNEWGNQIFYSNDQSDKWDGTYKGKEQPAGTYIYIFNGKVLDGEELKMNGEVNLIR
jgi:large repetitive protein